MAYKFSDGSSFSFSTTFASAKTIATFTNANPGVATSTSHGYVDDEELLLIADGWEDATDSVYRVNQLTADTFSLLTLDTSNTIYFPAGGGANATVQKVSSWVEIPQILAYSVGGGDARRATISPIKRRNPINVPLGLNPTDITITIGHDASNAAYQQMLAITRALTKCAFKLAMADGATVYGYGNMVVSSFPNLQGGRENQATVSINMLGREVAYG